MLLLSRKQFFVDSQFIHSKLTESYIFSEELTFKSYFLANTFYHFSFSIFHFRVLLEGLWSCQNEEYDFIYIFCFLLHKKFWWFLVKKKNFWGNIKNPWNVIFTRVKKLFCGKFMLYQEHTNPLDSWALKRLEMVFKMFQTWGGG